MKLLFSMIIAIFIISYFFLGIYIIEKGYFVHLMILHVFLGLTVYIFSKIEKE